MKKRLLLFISDPDPHFLSLLAGIGRLDPVSNSRPEPDTLRIDRPPLGKAMTVEELEKTFEMKGPGKGFASELDSSRSLPPLPPPGFLPEPSLELPVKLGIGPGLPQFPASTSPQNFLASLGIIGPNKHAVHGGSPVASLYQPPPGHPGLSKLPPPSLHQPVSASNPVGFRPFDPMASHPSPFPAAAFNPFNAFGPIGPGLLLPPKSGSPVCESPTVSLTNNSLGLSSPLGVSNI